MSKTSRGYVLPEGWEPIEELTEESEAWMCNASIRFLAYRDDQRLPTEWSMEDLENFGNLDEYELDEIKRSPFNFIAYRIAQPLERSHE